MNYQVIAEQLHNEGYAIIPIFSEDEVRKQVEEFEETLKALPEFKQDIDGDQYSKTGFGTLGTASSFHNPWVRKVRLELYMKLLPIFEAYEGMYGKGLMRRFFHTLFDRMLTRSRDQKASEEGWHRDQSIVFEGDTIFGGWLSLTDKQFVSLIPGTHHLKSEGTGFVKIDGERLEECNRKREFRDVPAGSILLMDQTLVHEVRNASSKKPTKRLFLGWRLTYDDEDLLAKGTRNTNPRQDGKGESQDLEKIIEEQMVPKIPSNQLPSLFNVRSVDTPGQQAALNAWIQKYIRPEFLEETHPDSFHKNKRDANGDPVPKYPYPLPPLHMPSLREIGRMYPRYKKEEKIILMPHSFADARAHLGIFE